MSNHKNFSNNTDLLIYLANTSSDVSNAQFIALEATLTPEESAAWVAYQDATYGAGEDCWRVDLSRHI